jgi:hypothetical protein
LFLEDNQLYGQVPEEICNQGDSSPDLGNNQLCPPYPECFYNLSYLIDGQDITNCWSCDDEDVYELWGACYHSEYVDELNFRYLSYQGFWGRTKV